MSLNLGDLIEAAKEQNKQNGSSGLTDLSGIISSLGGNGGVGSLASMPQNGLLSSAMNMGGGNASGGLGSMISGATGSGEGFSGDTGDVIGQIGKTAIQLAPYIMAML